MSLGLVIEGVSVMCYGIARTAMEVFLVSAAVGLGMGIVMPATIAFLGDVIPQEKRGLSMGIASMSVQLGIAIGSSTMGVVAELFGFCKMYVMCGVIHLFLSTLMVLVLAHLVSHIELRADMYPSDN